MSDPMNQTEAADGQSHLTGVLGAASYPATRTVHCPNGPTHACDEHAAQITGLMQYLGAHVVHTAAPDGAQCANCVNAASNNEVRGAKERSS